MITLRMLATISIFSLICIRVCDGIICFDCHSSTKPACGDNFRIQTSDVDSRWECDGKCYKRRGKRTSSGGEVRRTEVQRGCKITTKTGCFDEYINGMKQNTCVCTTNFCNASSSSRMSVFLLVVCTCAVVLSRLKNYWAL